MKKTILITGSTDGIGKLTAIKLAEKGHTVYVHGRSSEKLSAVISEIQTITKNENVKGVIGDFSDLDSVKRMTHQIKKEVLQIDVLINNAGVYNSSVSHNTDGIDMRFVVNYFAPYIVTNELLPLLNKGSEPRIINLSSAAQSSISYKTLLGKEKQSEGETYAQSKLALTMWSFYLAKTLQEISVIAVNPGSLLNTKMVKKAFGNFWSSADKGANILCELAISEEYKGVSGLYFDNDRGDFGKAHPDAYSEIEINKLIDTTHQFLHGH
ncbi:short-subunit dehydrogenase [Aquimarina sp. MAR_2010_214]|uniref:SDR family NAD(P)-dependent oxidoreductase n=1 Tax=Aquimarina sp. MAR_2010_214 TaxID=1250026 RepID=UPI000C709985|nr:SDR family NAD(P)-dependent oxidoreductase [Aquimarina sp. MAR_2010_214]PKV48234.1 short-subunit dehydrogenase [Aquimarina sp. MAR_2010_214]